MDKSLVKRIEIAQEHGDQYFMSASLTQKKSDINVFSPVFISAQQKLNKTLELAKSLSALQRQLRLNCKQIGESLVEIRKDLENGNFNQWNAEKLKTAVQEAENSCYAEWDRYVDERTGSTKSVVQSIKNVVAEDAEYKKMRTAQVNINKSKPGSKEAIDSIDSYLRHFNNLITAIQLDDEVLAFLKVLSENGSVSLSQLSNDCLRKLQSEAFANKLKIVIN